MTSTCGSCGKSYDSKKASKYCGGTCRQRASAARAKGRPLGKTASPSVELARKPVLGGLEAATTRELVDAGRLDSTLGQSALELSRRITSGHETGSAVASMVKQLRATMVDALRGVAAAADPLDELRNRRDTKRAIS